MYDTSFPLCVRRTHLTGSRVFHRAKQTYLLQTSSAWRKRKKRERESHSRSARYLPRLVNTLAVNSLNKLFPARKGHFAAGNWSLGRRTLDQTCASRIPAFWLPPLLPPPIVPNDSSPLEGSTGVNYFAALERLGRFCCNNESNYKN